LNQALAKIYFKFKDKKMSHSGEISLPPVKKRELFRPPEPFNGSFEGKNVISVEQFTQRKEIEFLFEVADQMKESVESKRGRDELHDATVVEAFYQPSTRTFISFQAAAQWLGCRRVIAIPGMSAYSSAVKGESLRDTIRTIEQTTAADVIVLRHPDDNSSQIAAAYSSVPVFNGGSGRENHPTQGTLDLYTIREELGRMDNLNVTMIGDLRNGRTIKSLSKLLALVGEGIRFNFHSPEVLKMPNQVISSLREKGAEVIEGNNDELEGVLSETDVLYVTRIQQEWFVKQAVEDLRATFGAKLEGVSDEALMALAKELGEREYQVAVDGYVIDPEKLMMARRDMIIMHPLPRVGEIVYEVDDDPRAAYFRQMRNGLYTRMALLAVVLGKV